MNTCMNIGYCQQHYKGGDRINQMHGEEHARWLLDCVKYLQEEVDWPIIVSLTGFRGMNNVPNSPGYFERDVLWEVFKRVRCFTTTDENPGHQVGAALCIRLGLECASKLGYDGMFHAAEDIVPFHGELKRLLLPLMVSDYVGEAWGVDRCDLNTQFFACRVQSLVGPFDPPAVTGTGGFLERYMAHLMHGKRVHHIERVYHHTHDYSDWNRCAHNERSKRQ